MSADAVRRAVEALNQGDIDAYGAAFHPDAMRTVPGFDEPVPAAAILDALRELHAAFDTFRLDARLLLEADDYVIARWHTTGTHTGTYLDIAPTGRSISTDTCEVYEFRDGRVTRSWSYGDPLALINQLSQPTD